MESPIDEPGLPEMMRAWTCRTRGLPTSVLSLSNVALPKIISSKDILIRVSHVSLNPVGSALVALLPGFIHKTPLTPELDFSGVIAAVGGAVDFKAGDSVFGSVPPSYLLRRGGGALAEYVVVPASNISRKPENLSFQDAAGLGVTGVTALGLMKDANLKQGNRVLLNGASGGVGTMAVQIARSVVGESGSVVAVCSGNNAELVKSLGADKVIDRKEHDPVYEYLAQNYGDSPFDAIVDAVGIQSLYDHSPKYLSKNGIVASVGVMSEDLSLGVVVRSILKIASNLYWPRLFGGVPRPYIQKTASVDSKGLLELRKLVEDGKLKVITDSLFQMDDAMQAYDRILSHKAVGKVCVQIRAE